MADMSDRNSPQRQTAASGHEIRYMRRVSEGSVRAECSCGWQGQKRTDYGGKAPEDAREHLLMALRERQGSWGKPYEEAMLRG
jgi:hypothetical protein